eukprot:GHVS01084793.1.p1 GENE.GHVS01084793.1~~GHVS01084793.1.p1  ORF type:complete len:131 (+),score=11.99 GHVS01084793.1:222-614(+)
MRHNELRAEAEVASLKWDTDLANYIREYMEDQSNFRGCAFEHSPNRAQVGSFERVGENLYMSFGFDPTGDEVADSWFEEVNCYSYGRVGDPCTSARLTCDFPGVVAVVVSAQECSLAVSMAQQKLATVVT